MKKLCGNCKSFTALGLEGSGILLPDKSAEWAYAIGQCKNTKSVHGGWAPVPGKCTEGGRLNMADWNKCELFKREVKCKG